MTHEKNPNFLHHHPRSPISNALREVVFGVEDGMVSTLGALTGIAIGTQNHFAVVLSGFVIVAVESLSMGIGCISQTSLCMNSPNENLMKNAMK